MKRSVIHFLVLVLGVCVMPPDSSGREQAHRLILDMKDSVIRSTTDAPSMLRLKRKIREQHPALDPSTIELKRVVVTAKNRQGTGRIQLRVGRSTTPAKIVAGQQNRFGTGSRPAFQRTALVNPAANSAGQWQLLFSGHFIVRKIVIFIENAAGPKGVDLGNSHWGTPAEGEKSCLALSNNAADGWQAPQNICSGNGVATYVHGYRPVRLSVRPDISSLQQRNIHRVEEITISATALSRDRSHHGHETVSFGVDIGGKTYRRTFSLAPPGLRDKSQHIQTLRIRGSWRPADIKRSRVWIRPNQASADFTVRSLRLHIR